MKYQYTRGTPTRMPLSFFSSAQNFAQYASHSRFAQTARSQSIDLQITTVAHTRVTRVRATPHLLPTMANLIFEEGDSHPSETSHPDYQQFDFPRDAHPPRKIKDDHRNSSTRHVASLLHYISPNPCANCAVTRVRHSRPSSAHLADFPQFTFPPNVHSARPGEALPGKVRPKILTCTLHPLQKHLEAISAGKVNCGNPSFQHYQDAPLVFDDSLRTLSLRLFFGGSGKHITVFRQK